MVSTFVQQENEDMICDVSSVHPKVLVDHNHCGDVCDMSTRPHRVWHYRNREIPMFCIALLSHGSFRGKYDR